MSKKDQLKDLITQLHDGVELEDVKKQFREEFGHISSAEIANLEQSLILDGTPVHEIKQLCNVHAEVFTGNKNDLHLLDQIDKEAGHPLFVFRKENQGIMEFLNEEVKVLLDAYRKDYDDKVAKSLRSSMVELYKIDRHYQRKENLFFPYLERASFNGPPQVMWAKDDEIRDLIKAAQKDSLKRESLVEHVENLIYEVEQMVIKENEILAPMLIDHIDDEDWLLIAKESSNFAYAFCDSIEGASLSDINTWIQSQEENESLKSSDASDSKRKAIRDEINLPSGRLTLDQLNYMLNTSPQDFTFIDAEDKVLYFSEGKNPVFPRTRTIIGRDVRLCHPPKAIPVVEQLLQDFKNNLKDEEVRYLMKDDKAFLIRYFAVRDEDNQYLGTLETTEDISRFVDEVNLKRSELNEED